MCLTWAPQQSEGVGTSTAGSHGTPQRIRVSSGCLCQWLHCNLWHHHPERCWCQWSQPRPWQGTGTDGRGGREQAEAVTIENKDFIFFFQFIGQFPLHRPKAPQPAVPRAHPSPAAKGSLQGLLQLRESCCFPWAPAWTSPPQALGGSKY